MVDTITITTPPKSPEAPVNPDAAAQAAIEGKGQQQVQQPSQQPTPPTDEQAENIANEAGLDVAAIESHWLEHGTIPEAELVKLAKVGITKELAEGYVAYRQSQAEAFQNELINEVGGNDAFEAMTKWAAASWDAAQLAAYNAAVESGDRGQIQLALKALKAKYMAADPPSPAKPKLVNVPNQGSSGVQAYQSLAEAQRDFSNPLYHQDTAFRDQVARRLAVSNIM